MIRLFVGLDVSKDNLTCVVKDDRNNLIMPARTYNHDRQDLEALNRCIGDLEKQFSCLSIIGMEATGIYHLGAYQHLLKADRYVKVFNALELKRFKSRIRKTKTDKLDAEVIAEALLLERDPGYHQIAEAELMRIRELCRMRERLVKRITLCKNQTIRDMDVLCRGYSNLFTNILSPSSIEIMKAAFRKTKLFRVETDTMVRILSRYMPITAAEKKAEQLSDLFKNAVIPEYMRDPCIMELHMLIQQYIILNQHKNRIEKMIEKHVLSTDTHLLSIPGVGALTAGVILGELGNLKRFKSHNQLTAFAGLDPSVMMSGRTHRTGHISKRGSPLLREALYQAALVASHKNPVCQQFYQRLKSNGKHHKVCLVAVARKLLHIAYSVETKQKDFYIPNYIVDHQA